MEVQLIKNEASKLPPIPKKDKTLREQEINRLINSDSILDASTILNIVSPQGGFDVFISHYHENEEIALNVASILQSQGYKPFVDSQCWLHFDNIAGQLNDLHYHKDNKGNEVYNHDKTIMVQKHCDVLLLSALAKVISKCNYLIFINPPESMIGIEHYSKQSSNSPKTYSPWIYWELLFAGILNERNTSMNEHFADSLSIPKIEYPLDVKNMVKINAYNVINNNWKEKKNNNN